MATIALVLDHQEGHLLPTFPLAGKLAERGHRVVYLTAADGGDFVRRNGFDFVPILEDVYPKGMFQTQREGTGLARTAAGPAAQLQAEPLQYVESLAEGPELAATVAALAPDLFLATSLFPLFPLTLRLRFGLPVILLTPYLRSRPRAEMADRLEQMIGQPSRGTAALRRLARAARPEACQPADLAQELLSLRELILCPAAFEIPRPDRRPEPEVFHVEAPVSRGRPSESADPFPWDRLDANKKLLLCSMGSQSYMAGAPALAHFYAAVAGAAQADPGWQLVLATGGLVEESDLPDLPADAVLARWLPQLQLLKRAAALITHGGLGAVREAIAHGVPMLVFPIGSDQPHNAARLVHHGLGLAGTFGQTSAREIGERLRRIDGEPAFRDNVRAMRERFLEAEREGTAVRLIEELLEPPE